MPEKDALELLKKDHEKVRELLSRLVATNGPQKRQELLAQIKEEVLIHAKLEEELFYPAFATQMDNKDGRVMVIEAKEEHTMAERALADCEEVDPASEDFEGRATVLKELIEHHAKDEEEEMFPMAREVMKEKRLQRLAEELLARKKALQQKWEKEQTV